MHDPDLLMRTRQALADGQPDQAQTLALSRDTRDLKDPALHLAWADVLEELGLVDEVVKELHLAIRDAPDDQTLYPRLAEIYQDLGRPDRAAQVWAAPAPPPRPWRPCSFRPCSRITSASSNSSGKSSFSWRTWSPAWPPPLKPPALTRCTPPWANSA